MRSFIDSINASICTGASGVLGAAVFDAFAKNTPEDTANDHAVIGLANSRSGGDRNLHKLNLLDTDAVSTFFRDAKPNCKPSLVRLVLGSFSWCSRVTLPSTTYPSNQKFQAAALSYPSMAWWSLKLTLFRARRGDTLCGGAQA